MPATLPGNVLFAAGWDTGTLLRGSGASPPGFNGSSGSPTVVSNHPAGSGYARAALFSVDNTKYDGYGDRSEVQGSTGEVEGQLRWYKWSFYMPSSFPVLATWQVFGQWHSSANGSPPLAFYSNNGTTFGLDFNLATGSSEPRNIVQYGRRVWQVNMSALKGQWNEIVMRIVWSSSDSVASHRIWLNGQQQVFNGTYGNGQTELFLRNTDPGRSHYYKQGYYRGHTSSLNALTIYYSGFEIRDGAGGGTVVFDGSPPPPPPDPTATPEVTALSAVAGNASATLAWTNPESGIDTVQVRYDTTSFPTSTTGTASLTDSVAPYSESHTISGLTNGTQYRISVFTVNGGLYSDAVTTTVTPTSAPPPDPPPDPTQPTDPPDSAVNRFGAGSATGTYNTSQPDSIRGSSYSVSETKSLTGYRVWCGGGGTGSGSQTFKCCLYLVTSANYLEDTLVAGSTSAEGSVTFDAANSWALVSLAAPIDIDPGTYRICLHSGPNQVSLYGFSNDAPMVWADDTYSDGPASTYAGQAGTVHGTWTPGLAAYAVVDEASSPTPATGLSGAINNQPVTDPLGYDRYFRGNLVPAASSAVTRVAQIGQEVVSYRRPKFFEINPDGSIGAEVVWNVANLQFEYRDLQ